MKILRRAQIVAVAISLLVIPSAISFAGMGSNFKGKIQKQLSDTRNVQYGALSSQSEAWGGQQNARLDSDKPAPQELSAQQSPMVAGVSGPAPSVPVVAQGAVQNREEIMKKPADIGHASVPTEPAASYVIYNMKYTSELEENVVTVKGEILFEVFEKNGPVKLPLVSNSVGLIDVRVNKGASFVTSQGGMYYLIMNRTGRYNLEYEFLIKATRERENGPGSFSVDVVPAPISQFEFTIPEKDTQIFIEPAIRVETTTEGEKTNAWAVLPNTNHIQVRWTRALPKEAIVSAKLEPKVYAETATYATIGNGVISNTTHITYSILQSEVTSLRVALPEDVSVLEVRGNDLRDWKVSSKDGTQYIDVFLNFGVKGNYQLNFTYERPIGDGSGVLEMPWVRAMNTERENGYYGIAASSNVELAAKSSEKVTAIDIKQLPQVIWAGSDNPILLAFKYLSQPFAITIEVTRHEELPVLVAAIDSARFKTLRTEDGKVLTKATYQVRNNVKQFLRLDIPVGAKIWSSFVSGKPVKPAMDKERHVLLPLEKSRMMGGGLTQFPVEVVYLNEEKSLGGWGTLKLGLPKADVPVSQMNWEVSLPQDYTYFSFGGDMRQSGYVQSRSNYSREASFSQSDMVGQERKKEQSESYDSKQNALPLDELSGIKDGNVMMRGLLPITVDVPQEGRTFNFSKSLVIEGESPWMSVRYVHVPYRLGCWLETFVRLLGFLVVVVLVWKLVRNRINFKSKIS